MYFNILDKRTPKLFLLGHRKYPTQILLHVLWWCRNIYFIFLKLEKNYNEKK